MPWLTEGVFPSYFLKEIVRVSIIEFMHEPAKNPNVLSEHEKPDRISEAVDIWMLWARDTSKFERTICDLSCCVSSACGTKSAHKCWFDAAKMLLKNFIFRTLFRAWLYICVCVNLLRFSSDRLSEIRNRKKIYL